MSHRLTFRPISLALALGRIVSGAIAGCASSDTASAGCTKDSDCKGDRICSLEGQCIDAATTTSTSVGAGGNGGATASIGTASSSTAASTGSGMMCGSGLTSCGGKCVDTKIDAANCGVCANACAANVSCVNSKCTRTRVRQSLPVFSRGQAPGELQRLHEQGARKR